ncbi:hypothetical protein GCM10018952_25460 [Streptosporangium vulgare]
MAPLLPSVTQWHASGPPQDLRTAPPVSRDQALAAVRRWLVADHRASQYPRYLTAIADLERGWTTARMGGLTFVAFACGCPISSPPEQQAGAALISRINRGDGLAFGVRHPCRKAV